jgi:hypothetical protein
VLYEARQAQISEIGIISHDHAHVGAARRRSRHHSSASARYPSSYHSFAPPTCDSSNLHCPAGEVSVASSPSLFCFSLEFCSLAVQETVI